MIARSVMRNTLTPDQRRARTVASNATWIASLSSVVTGIIFCEAFRWSIGKGGLFELVVLFFPLTFLGISLLLALICGLSNRLPLRYYASVMLIPGIGAAVFFLPTVKDRVRDGEPVLNRIASAALVGRRAKRSAGLFSFERSTVDRGCVYLFFGGASDTYLCWSPTGREPEPSPYAFKERATAHWFVMHAAD